MSRHARALLFYGMIIKEELPAGEEPRGVSIQEIGCGEETYALVADGSLTEIWDMDEAKVFKQGADTHDNTDGFQSVLHNACKELGITQTNCDWTLAVANY